MAKVFLRVYNHEIESMIEGGQLDEACAHCQHILKTFPMHIETYRLLGKAFLEARRYADAADIFQRALMAVPDDFVSHVGMSIIRDDEGNLNEAIWHMERAFEVQPSNSAIQGELRRLYGRRDGVEPSKIRLSRDALANMYSQGELFNQAIAEIRSVLAEDPNRPDLQVMLARAYYRSGQKVEAAEMAANLLKKYSYCMDALRILVDVLPGTGRAENTQVYRQRLILLDPYSSFTINSVFESDQVVDSAVNMERLEYKTGPATVSPQADWASSLGIKLNDEKQADTPPDWMQVSENAESSNAFAPEPSGADTQPSAEAAAGAVPDWMRSAGWQESAGAEPDGSAVSEDSQSEMPIAKADIPEWLKSMAPAEAPESVDVLPEEPAEQPSFSEDGIPDWLKQMKPAGDLGEAPIETSHQPAPQSADSNVTTDWLQSLAPVGAAADETQPTVQSSVDYPSTDDNAVPDWLQSLQPGGAASDDAQQVVQPPVDSPLTGDSAFPDWLQSLKPSGAVSDDVQQIVQPPIDSPSADDNALPDWLQSLASPESSDETSSASQPSIESQFAVEDGDPDWLDSKTPINQLLTDPGSVSDSVASPEPAISTVSSPQVQAGTFQPSGESKPLEIGDDALGWLESLAAKQGARPEELLTQPHERFDEMPDWLRQSGERLVDGIQPVSSEPVRAEVLPAQDESLPLEPIKSAVQPASAGDATWPERLPEDKGAEPKAEPVSVEPLPAQGGAFPNWLTDMGARATAAGTAAALVAGAMEQSAADVQPVEFPEPVIQEPAISAASMPQVQAGTYQPSGESKPLEIGDDALGWLESLAAKQGARPEELLTQPHNRSDEMPDWLRQPDEQAAAPAPSVSESDHILAENLPIEPPIRFTEPSVSQPDQPVEEVIPAQKDTLPAESTEPTAQSADAGDDTMAWLEQLSTEQILPRQGMGGNAENSSSTIPDWVQKVDDENPNVSVPQESLPVLPEVAADGDVSITSWLSRMDVEEALGGKRPDVSVAATQPAVPADELPDWLKDVEKPTTPLETSQADNDLPEWLRHPIPLAESTPAAPSSASEPAPEQGGTAWIDDNVPVDQQAVPTIPEEWMPAEMEDVAGSSGYLPAAESAPVVEAIPVVEPASVAEPVSIPVQPPAKPQALKQTGMLSPIPLQDKDSELLSSAQTILDQNSLDDAMKKYTKLIKKGRLLDEVIHDLREAIYRYPVDVIVWQTLGDAYMRANRLQDALDAYTKAEELLR